MSSKSLIRALIFLITSASVKGQRFGAEWNLEKTQKKQMHLNNLEATQNGKMKMALKTKEYNVAKQKQYSQI